MMRLVVVLLSVLPLFGQVPATTTRPASAPIEQELPTDDVGATALLTKAAKRQITGDAPFSIADFQADLEATIYETDRDTGTPVARSAHVTQFFRVAGDGATAYRSDRFEALTKKQVTRAFDGKSHWMRLGKEPARELLNREDREDRQANLREITRTKDLVATLVLRDLLAEGARRRPLGKREFTAAGKSIVAEGISVHRKGQPRLDVWIGTDDASLVAMQRTRAEGPSEMLVMSLHRPLTVGAHVLSMPQVIEAFENDRLVLEVRASGATAIKVNSGIEDRVFALPR